MYTHGHAECYADNSLDDDQAACTGGTVFPEKVYYSGGTKEQTKGNIHPAEPPYRSRGAESSAENLRGKAFPGGVQ